MRINFLLLFIFMLFYLFFQCITSDLSERYEGLPSSFHSNAPPPMRRYTCSFLLPLTSIIIKTVTGLESENREEATLLVRENKDWIISLYREMLRKNKEDEKRIWLTFCYFEGGWLIAFFLCSWAPGPRGILQTPFSCNHADRLLLLLLLLLLLFFFKLYLAQQS